MARLPLILLLLWACASAQTSNCILTTNVSGLGAVTPASGSEFSCGTRLSINAVPEPGWRFVGWSSGLPGNRNPFQFTLNADTTITAAFVPDDARVTGDPRELSEPSFRPVCSALTALQSAALLDESSPDTERIQTAIDACPAGAAVRLSASGESNAFLIAPVTLKAGVSLQIDAEVTVFGSVTYSDYHCDAKANSCAPLIAVAPNSAEPGSAIMGYGTIDGRGGVPLIGRDGTWWDEEARPRLIYLGSGTQTSADYFTLFKVTLKDSPKFHLSGVGNNLTVWGVKIIAPPDSPNTDGIDPSASANITITRSFISVGDDMVAIKAGNGHVSNVTVSHLSTYSGHGISIGSETNAGADNILITDAVMDNGFGGASRISLRIKSDSSRGGEIRNVLYDGVCMLRGGNALVFNPYYSTATGSLIPNFHDITVRNLRLLLRDSSKKSSLIGYNSGPVVNPLNITLDNVIFDGWTNNDFQAPNLIRDANISLGPGPVNFAAQLKALASVASNGITVTDGISNSNPPYDCSPAKFLYLAGELAVGDEEASPDQPVVLTAILQNLVSPPMHGEPQYPQQNAPTGAISILEGESVVGTAEITGRVTKLTITAPIEGTHTYTAAYSGDTNFAPLNFGSATIVRPAPAGAGAKVRR